LTAHSYVNNHDNFEYDANRIYKTMVYIIGFFFLTSLLTVFKAPAKPLWYASIAATEWGHVLAVLCILLAVLYWRLPHRWNSPFWLALVAAALYLRPLASALALARRLPDEMTARFGPQAPQATPLAPGRLQPLDGVDLFRGIPSPAVRMTSHVYATVHGQDLLLDLYHPELERRGKGWPVVVVIHGGSWKSGDRTGMPALNRYLAARGYGVASIDYRLAPGALFPAQRDDVFAALAYLKAHAVQWQLNPDEFVLIGRSAGVQIALSAAYAEKDAAIKGVVAFYSPNDLIWGYDHPTNPLVMNSREVLEMYLGGSPLKVPRIYEEASPVFHVNNKTPPTLMIHGLRDVLVSDHHEDLLSKRLAEAGRPYYYLRLPWATHGCDANFSGPSGQLSTYAIERFLAAVLVKN
jgi:acetyl esterase/lipase